MILTLQFIYLLVPIAFAFTFVAHFAFCIHAILLRIQAERAELSNIPYMNKKELIKLAQAHGIRYSGLNKYNLANVLITELA